MTHQELSNLSHEELSHFNHLQLQLQTLTELSDKLTRDALDIPTDISVKLTPLVSSLLSSEHIIKTLPDIIHVIKIICSTYSIISGKGATLSAFASAIDEVVQYFSSKIE